MRATLKEGKSSQLLPVFFSIESGFLIGETQLSIFLSRIFAKPLNHAKQSFPQAACGLKMQIN